MRILVSGTSQGIGKAIAERFLANGHEVFGVDRKPSSIFATQYHHIQMDIRDEDLPEIADLGVIIASAGVDNEEEAIDINLLGTISFVERYLDSEKLKSVLFIASSSARNGAEFPFYSASKGGLVAYMKNLALKLSGKGVTVNSISPGAVITPMNERLINDKTLFQAIADESLLGKWALPEEIAEWAYFLTLINLSMTGEDLLIDNGEMLKSNFIH